MLLRRRISHSLLVIFVAVFLLFGQDAEATCKGKFINPITDICWQCMFPLMIAGVKLIDSDLKPPLGEGTDSPVCVCKDGTSVVLGLRTAFFEPARIAETVKDPYCFTILGAELGNPDAGFGGGTTEDRGNENPNTITFAQAHWYIFPAFALLDLFVDFPCFEDLDFSIAFFTEPDSLWNNDLYSFVIQPEAVVFANPIAQLSCAADSIATHFSKPIDAMFWCMGSWGSAYPMAGNISNPHFVEANAALSAKMIYRMTRLETFWDRGTDVCGAVMLPIWKKSHFRLHMMKPVRDKTCHPIGKSSILWASGKNPPISTQGNASDNFTWMYFRKLLCCAGYKFP